MLSADGFLSPVVLLPWSRVSSPSLQLESAFLVVKSSIATFEYVLDLLMDPLKPFKKFEIMKFYSQIRT